MPLPRALFDSLPPHHPHEEMVRILEEDHRKNHVGRAYDCAFTTKLVMLWKGNGGMLFCAENLLFTIQEQTPTTVEFHVANAGTPRYLFRGMDRLLTALAPHYEYAATYYDSPRVSAVAKHLSFPAIITRIDAGEDRMFEAKFKLRS